MTTTVTTAPAHPRSGTIIHTLETSTVQTDTIDIATPDPVIAAAADHVARAEADFASHQRVTQQAREAEQQLADRIADLDTRRAAIGARRQDGDRREGDGAELELLTLDRQGLAEMLAEAAQTRAEAQEAEQQAAQVAGFARQALQHAEDQATLAALKAHADAVGRVLRQTVEEMAAIGRRIGSHNFRWQPDSALMDRLRGAAIAGRPL